jgi:hypothetical protein
MTTATMQYTFGDCVIKAPVNSRLEKMCQQLKQEFPKLKMRHKRDVWYHWIAHVLICIFTVGLQRKYISTYTTTGKNVIDWGDKHWDRIQKVVELDRVWACAKHEREHLRQFAKLGVVLMAIIWAIPPCLFCFGRALYIEKPGYIESLRAKFEIDRAWAEHPDYRKYWVGQFTGPAYGWMWILRKQVEKWFDTELAALQQAA